MRLMARQDFLAREIEQAVANGAYVFGQFPGNGGHRNTSVTTVGSLLARSLRGASAERPGKPRYETCIAHWRRSPADTIRCCPLLPTLFGWTAHERANGRERSQFDEI